MSKRPVLLGDSGSSASPAPVAEQVRVDVSPPPFSPAAQFPIPAAPVAAPAVIGAPNLGNFPVALVPGQVSAVTVQLAGMDFLAMPAQDIALIGSDAERTLQQVLDGFLGGMDRLRNPRLFELFERLQRGVEEQKLPAIADQILNGRRSLWDDLKNKLRSKEGRRQAAGEAREEIVALVRGATSNLVDLMNKMDAEMRAEQSRLVGEIDRMDTLTQAYHERFEDFVIAAAVAHVFLARARAQVEQIASGMNPEDPVQATRLAELRNKLEGLESRALALEGTMTRLPADQLVLGQLKDAGIGTLREVATTAVARVASIKMTLITLGQALVVKGVQDLSAQGAALDERLTGVRGRLLKEVVTVAANAPGENRQAQADQIAKIVRETGELMGIVSAAKEANAQKFANARQTFANARQQMLAQAQGQTSGR